MDESNTSSSITVKTAHRLWHSVIFLTPIILFGSITLLLLLNHSSSSLFASSLFVTLCSGFGSYFLANYLTKSDTHFSFEYGTLTIEQNNNKVKKDMRRQFELSAIRGYEISELKNTRSLIIYLNDYSYYKYPLYSIDESLELKTLLCDKITSLTVKNNPNFSSFCSAFSFAIVRVFISSLLVISLVYGGMRVSDDYQWRYADHKFLIISAFLIISTLAWKFIVSIPSKRKNIRHMGFALQSFYFLGISFIIILPASIKMSELEEQPIALSRVDEIFHHPKKELFYIQHTSYTPERILFYKPLVKKGGRSNKFIVEHLFITPITSPTAKQPIQVINFWLTLKYVQRIPKALPLETKESMLNTFGLQAKAKLIHQLQKKPQFFKVVYNDVNQIKNYNAAYELVKSSGISNRPTVILDPHWEALESYKNKLKLAIFWMCLGMICLNVIAAVVIAVYR
ncbi:MAG: hypothetical protein EOO07_04170 [Chitinophagaceae bacterium]|nr:MAG: hypothetical protein EOO07_04170 [Chitinophagaceae bacterium]